MGAHYTTDCARELSEIVSEYIHSGSNAPSIRFEPNMGDKLERLKQSMQVIGKDFREARSNREENWFIVVYADSMITVYSNGIIDLHDCYIFNCISRKQFDVIYFDKVQADADDYYSHFQLIETTANKIDFNGVKVINLRNMSTAFDYCEIGEIEFTPLDTSKLSNMENMFYKAKIGKLNISNFTYPMSEQNSMCSINGMFKNSEIGELIAGKIGSYDTSQAQSLFSFAAIRKHDIEEIIINPSEVIDNSSMFYGARIDFRNIKRIYIGKSNIASMFNLCRCTMLDTRILEGEPGSLVSMFMYDPDHVSSKETAFDSAIKIDFSEKFDTSHVYDMRYFIKGRLVYYCNFSNCDFSNLRQYEGAVNEHSTANWRYKFILKNRDQLRWDINKDFYKHWNKATLFLDEPYEIKCPDCYGIVKNEKCTCCGKVVKFTQRGWEPEWLKTMNIKA